ncbi:MAG: MFS transporter [Nitrososphaerota archaeon]|jgi:MFS family permease|nr:MFS transporter [Nitrososphaerota archaeon]MDG6941723.1 MFS transporter [Nitrososphaerota archaeon]MDG6947103.1 MFS transporter [Nitrososphaerota archaeon]MDG6951347.1 MFS transporter [Nitrososphaerota archaeon]
MWVFTRYGLRGLMTESYVLFAIRTINSFGFSMAMPFFGIYLVETRGVSLLTTGLVYFVAGVLSMAGQVFGGRIVDVVGPKKVMLTGYVMSIVSSVALGYMVLHQLSAVYFFAVYPLFSLLRSFSNPATGSIIAGHPQNQIRPGYNLLTIGGNLGFAIGPAIGGLIADTYGYSVVFFLSATSVVPVIVLTILMIRGGAAHAARESGARRSLSWKDDSTVISFLVLTGAMFVAVGYEITPLSLYVADFLHFTDTQIGYLFATNGAVIVLLQLPLIDLVQRARVLIFPLLVSPLVVALSFVMAGLFNGFLQYELVMISITLGEILLTVPSQTVIALFSRPGNRGTYQGYYYAASNMGRSTANAAGPSLFQALSFAPALGWYVMAGFAVVVFIGFLALGPRLQRDYEGLPGQKGGEVAGEGPPGVPGPAKLNPYPPR